MRVLRDPAPWIIARWKKKAADREYWRTQRRIARCEQRSAWHPRGVESAAPAPHKREQPAAGVPAMPKRRTPPRRRSPGATALRSPALRHRVVPSKLVSSRKTKGSANDGLQLQDPSIVVSEGRKEKLQ
jgi:hypothetical protein